jgi:hypothetical protein
MLTLAALQATVSTAVTVRREWGHGLRFIGEVALRRNATFTNPGRAQWILLTFPTASSAIDAAQQLCVRVIYNQLQIFCRGASVEL